MKLLSMESSVVLDPIDFHQHILTRHILTLGRDFLMHRVLHCFQRETYGIIHRRIAHGNVIVMMKLYIGF